MFPLLIAAAIANTPAAPAPQGCDPGDHVQPAGAAAAIGPHRLDRGPASALYLTVFRTVDSCPAPVIVRAPGQAGLHRR